MVDVVDDVNTRSGKTALVRYKGRALGGSCAAIEDLSGSDPVKICIGVGQVPRGIDEALYDMEIGEQRTIAIPPEKGYGKHDPAGVRLYQRASFPNGDDLYEGYVGRWKNPLSGQFIPAVCTKATKDYVSIDFNHPLAGKRLEYWIELVDILD